MVSEFIKLFYNVSGNITFTRVVAIQADIFKIKANNYLSSRYKSKVLLIHVMQYVFQGKHLTNDSNDKLKMTEITLLNIKKNESHLHSAALILDETK